MYGIKYKKRRPYRKRKAPTDALQKVIKILLELLSEFFITKSKISNPTL